MIAQVWFRCAVGLIVREVNERYRGWSCQTGGTNGGNYANDLEGELYVIAAAEAEAAP